MLVDTAGRLSPQLRLNRSQSPSEGTAPASDQQLPTTYPVRVTARWLTRKRTALCIHAHEKVQRCSALYPDSQGGLRLKGLPHDVARPKCCDLRAVERARKVGSSAKGSRIGPTRAIR